MSGWVCCKSCATFPHPPISLPSTASLCPPERMCVWGKGAQNSHGFWGFWAQFSPRFHLGRCHHPPDTLPPSDHFGLRQLVLDTHLQRTPAPLCPPISLTWGTPRWLGQRTKAGGVPPALLLEPAADPATRASPAQSPPKDLKIGRSLEGLGLVPSSATPGTAPPKDALSSHPSLLPSFLLLIFI